MQILARAILINVIVTSSAGLLSIMIFSQALLVTSDLLSSALWVLGSMSALGLFIHAIFMERWLRPVNRLVRSLETGLKDLDRQMQDLRDSAAFPVRSFVLTSLLWMFLIVVGMAQFNLAVDISSYEIYVISAILLSVGAWAWILQLFLNRHLVIPVMERYLDAHNQVWRHDDPFFTQSLFPVRAKWIVLSLFLVGFATFVSVVFTASWVRSVTADDAFRMLERRVDALQPMIESELAGEPSGGGVSNDSADRIAYWLQSEFWIRDVDNRVILSSGQGETIQEVMRSGRFLDRRLTNGRHLIAASSRLSELELVIPYFWVFLLVLLATGATVSVVAILVGRDLSHSLRFLKQLTARYDEGDFRAPPALINEDDLGSVSLIIGDVRSILGTVLEALKHSGVVFQESNEEILISSSRLLSGSEEQRRTLQQMYACLKALEEQYRNQSTSLRELDESISQNRDFATGSDERFGEMDKVATTMVETLNRFSTLFDELLSGINLHSDTLKMWRETAANVRRRTDRILVHAASAVEQISRMHRINLDRERIEGQQRLLHTRLDQYMKNIDAAVQRMGGLANRVEESMGDLGEALGWVNEIGDDTRLLSMNAAILSAKAADDGRSFSVIAQNIAELADLSGGSVISLQESIDNFSNRSVTLREKVERLQLRYAELDAHKRELISNEQGIHASVDALLRLDREIVRLSSFFSEKYSALQSQLESATTVLDSINSNFGNQRYRFEEMQMKLKTASNRIFEIKGNSQYQMTRARSVQESLGKVSGVVVEIVGITQEHVNAMNGLSEMGEHIVATISTQVRTMAELESMLKQFDQQARGFGADLNLYKVAGEV